MIYCIICWIVFGLIGLTIIAYIKRDIARKSANRCGHSEAMETILLTYACVIVSPVLLPVVVIGGIIYLAANLFTIFLPSVDKLLDFSKKLRRAIQEVRDEV